MMLMKIYHAAGLKDMIELFHRGVLTKCVAQAVSFDTTHTFLLQCWKAFYRFENQLFFLFLDHDDNMMTESNFSYEDACEIIYEYLKLLNESDISSASVHAKLTELQIYLDTVNKQFTLFYKDFCAKKQNLGFLA